MKYIAILALVACAFAQDAYESNCETDADCAEDECCWNTSWEYNGESYSWSYCWYYYVADDSDYTAPVDDGSSSDPVVDDGSSSDPAVDDGTGRLLQDYSYGCVGDSAAYLLASAAIVATSTQF